MTTTREIICRIALGEGTLAAYAATVIARAEHPGDRQGETAYHYQLEGDPLDLEALRMDLDLDNLLIAIS